MALINPGYREIDTEGIGARRIKISELEIKARELTRRGNESINAANDIFREIKALRSGHIFLARPEREAAAECARVRRSGMENIEFAPQPKAKRIYAPRLGRKRTPEELKEYNRQRQADRRARRRAAVVDISDIL